MSRLSLSRTDRLLFGILLVLVVLGALLTWLFMPPEKSGGFVSSPSTFYNVRYGTKAAYLTLHELGYPVNQLRRPIDYSTLKGTGVLFMLNPILGLNDFESEALQEWVKEGHALVIAPGAADSEMDSNHACRGGKCGVRGSYIDEWFRLVSVEENEDKKIRVDLGVNQPLPDWQPDRDDPLIEGIGPLVAKGCWRFSPETPLRGVLEKSTPHIFWKDKQGTVAFQTEFGDGTIIALSDLYFLTNLGIREGDNVLLLDNIVATLTDRYPGSVSFDEYHLGFAHRDWSALAIAKLTFTGGWRWAAAQAALVGLLLLFAGTVRFGSPRDVVLKKRRNHREFAVSAGRLLRDAGATSMATEELIGYYRNRLCGLVHIESDADDNRLARAVGDSLGYDIQPLLAQCGEAVNRPLGRHKLLTIVKELHQVVEALDHGT